MYCRVCMHVLWRRARTAMQAPLMTKGEPRACPKNTWMQAEARAG